MLLLTMLMFESPDDLQTGRILPTKRPSLCHNYVIYGFQIVSVEA